MCILRIPNKQTIYRTFCRLISEILALASSSILAAFSSQPGGRIITISHTESDNLALAFDRLKLTLSLFHNSWSDNLIWTSHNIWQYLNLTISHLRPCCRPSQAPLPPHWTLGFCGNSYEKHLGSIDEYIWTMKYMKKLLQLNIWKWRRISI